MRSEYSANLALSESATRKPVHVSRETPDHSAKLWKLIGWIGTLTSVLGSFAVAFGYMLPGYSLFLVGAVSWLGVGYVTRQWSLFVLNGFFFAANIIGFFRNFH